LLPFLFHLFFFSLSFLLNIFHYLTQRRKRLTTLLNNKLFETSNGTSRWCSGGFNLCNVPISPEDWSLFCVLVIQMLIWRHSAVMPLCALGLRPVIITSWRHEALVPEIWISLPERHR
jgi:hypothetical protein